LHNAAIPEVETQRWPEIVVKVLAQEEPAWTTTADDAADLGGCKRGGEALRLAVKAQRVRRMVVASTPVVEPMPVVI